MDCIFDNLNSNLQKCDIFDARKIGKFDSTLESKPKFKIYDVQKSRGSVKAFLACQKKFTSDENQKVKFDIKIVKEEDETRHSFFRRVANSRRFTHTIKGKTFFST